ncbi:MAG TPA: DNA polymerase III subunit epsilon [Caulobacteraceae bacterium]|jgi:DNA polymerase-3 subunit epsilon
MAREICLDVETTGLSPRDGHRVIEIACVELDGFVPTGRHFHAYVHPDRDIPLEAERIHGISLAKLEGKPRFAAAEVVDALIDFIAEAPLIAHNAAFDREFVNFELSRAGSPILAESRWIDTLSLAQKRFPGMSNSLDSLCKRFRISLAEREKHGALIDARLLANVYLELRGGRERRLDLEGASVGTRRQAVDIAHAPRPRPLGPRLTQAEAAAHAAFVAAELKAAIWLRPE